MKLEPKKIIMKNKNIFILPTDKTSRLYFDVITKELLLQDRLSTNPTSFPIEKRNIYITSDEEIKQGNWCFDTTENLIVQCLRTAIDSYWNKNCKKIILTTNQDLIKDGVQKIDDEFLEWFVKNPSCERVEINKLCYGALSGFADAGYKIIIPKEKSKEICEYCKIEISKYGCACGGEPKQETLTNDTDSHSWGFENFKVIKTEEDVKIFVETMENIPEPNDKLKKAFKDFNKQETLEETAEEYCKEIFSTGMIHGASNHARQAFIQGAKWQQEQNKGLYSEEDLKKYGEFCVAKFNKFNSVSLPNDYFEQFKKQ